MGGIMDCTKRESLRKVITDEDFTQRALETIDRVEKRYRGRALSVLQIMEILKYIYELEDWSSMTDYTNDEDAGLMNSNFESRLIDTTRYFMCGNEIDFVALGEEILNAMHLSESKKSEIRSMGLEEDLWAILTVITRQNKNN